MRDVHMKGAVKQSYFERWATVLTALFIVVSPLRGHPEVPSVAVLSEVSVRESRVLLTDLLTAESRQLLQANDRLISTAVAVSPLTGKVKVLDGGIVRSRLA